MTTDELAREAAALFAAADPSGTKSIRQLAELAARRVQACSGATATLWRDDEAVTMAASHPDLAALTSLQIETGSGPTLDAVRTGEPRGCADTLAEDRWPEFAAAALSRGVRCCVSLVHEFGGMAVTLTLYSVRPRSLDPAAATARLAACRVRRGERSQRLQVRRRAADCVAAPGGRSGPRRGGPGQGNPHARARLPCGRSLRHGCGASHRHSTSS